MLPILLTTRAAAKAAAPARQFDFIIACCSLSRSGSVIAALGGLAVRAGELHHALDVGRNRDRRGAAEVVVLRGELDALRLAADRENGDTLEALGWDRLLLGVGD